jgi:hypothetical protein
MKTIPDVDELLEVVAHFLRADVAKNTAAPTSFYALVAANALDIVRRELTQGADAEADATKRLRELLGRTDGDATELEILLAGKIRSGELTRESAGLLEHLRLSALAQLAIDQPSYATHRHVMRDWSKTRTLDSGKQD